MAGRRDRDEGLVRELDRALELERRLIDSVRLEGIELGFTMKGHRIVTDEEKGVREVTLHYRRDLSGQGALPLSRERDHHPDNA